MEVCLEKGVDRDGVEVEVEVGGQGADILD
jgi:hypothetical protein